MRKSIYALKSLLLICLLTLTGGGAWAQTEILNETFDAFNGKGGNDATWSNISSNKEASVDGWTFVKGNAASACVSLGTSKAAGSATTPALSKLQGAATLTFRAGAWAKDATTISVSISEGGLAVGSGAPASEVDVTLVKGAFSGYTIQITNGTANSTITFAAKQASGNRFFLDDVKVVSGGSEVTKANPELSFSAETATANIGESFTAPTLTNPHAVSPITWTSSDESVATVNADGAVSIVAAGATTITAKFAGNDEYYAGTASYQLTVVDPSSIVTYKKAAAVKSGAHYLLAADDNGALKVAKPVTSNYGWLYVNDATAENGVITLDSSDSEYIIEGDAENGYTIKQVSDGRYLYMTGTFNSFNLTDSLSKVTDNGAYWTIAANADGTFLIRNKEKGDTIQYSSQYTSFGAYEDKRGTFPALYERVFTIPAIATAEGYATLYSADAFVMPEGLAGTTAKYDEANNTLNYAWEYQAGATVPAETALLIKGTKGQSYDATVLTSDEAAPAGNVFYGTLKNETPTEEGKYYMLTYSNEGDAAVLGFYYANEDGSAFENKGGKAYLRLPATAAAAAKGFSIDGKPTGITGVTADAQTAPAAIYTISGVRVNGTLSSQPKGVYIVNGKKVVK